jgi:hypothetical protein
LNRTVSASGEETIVVARSAGGRFALLAQSDLNDAIAANFFLAEAVAAVQGLAVPVVAFLGALGDAVPAFQAAKFRTAVVVGIIIVIALFTGVQGSVAASRSTLAWLRIVTGESRFHGAIRRAAVAVGIAAVVAGLARIEIAVPAGLGTNVGSARVAGITELNRAGRRAAVSVRGISVVATLARLMDPVAAG